MELASEGLNKIQLRTGYFGKHYAYQNPVSIARKTVVDIPVYSLLAPNWKTIMSYKSSLCQETYIKEYYESVLNRLNPREVIQDLSKYGKVVTLLCYEKPNEFCHRHIVAKWLSHHLKIEVKEDIK